MSARYRRSPGLLWRTGLDRVLVLPPGGDDVLVLSGTGVALWEELHVARSASELGRSLGARYGADESVAADLRPVLEELCARRVLEVSAP